MVKGVQDVRLGEPVNLNDLIARKRAVAMIEDQANAKNADLRRQLAERDEQLEKVRLWLSWKPELADLKVATGRIFA